MKVKQNIIQFFWKMIKSVLRLLGNKNKALILSWLSENNKPFIEKKQTKRLLNTIVPVLYPYHDQNILLKLNLKLLTG